MSATLSSVSVAVPVGQGEQLAAALAAIAGVEPPTWTQAAEVAGGGRGCRLQLGGAVDVFEVATSSTAPSTALKDIHRATVTSLDVAVTDVDAAVERLTAAGFSVGAAWTGHPTVRATVSAGGVLLLLVVSG